MTSTQEVIEEEIKVVRKLSRAALALDELRKILLASYSYIVFSFPFIIWAFIYVIYLLSPIVSYKGMTIVVSLLSVAFIISWYLYCKTLRILRVGLGRLSPKALLYMIFSMAFPFIVFYGIVGRILVSYIPNEVFLSSYFASAWYYALIIYFYLGYYWYKKYRLKAYKHMIESFKITIISMAALVPLIALIYIVALKYPGKLTISYGLRSINFPTPPFIASLLCVTCMAISYFITSLYIIAKSKRVFKHVSEEGGR